MQQQQQQTTPLPQFHSQGQLPQQQFQENKLSSNLYKLDFTKPIYMYYKDKHLNKQLKHYIELETVTLSPTFIENVDYKIMNDQDIKKQLYQKLINEISSKYLKQQNLINQLYTNPMDSRENHQYITNWQATELKLEQQQQQFYLSFNTKPFAFTMKSFYDIITQMQASLWDKTEIRQFFNKKKLFINEYYAQKVVYTIKDIRFDLSPQSIMDYNTKKTFMQHYEDKYELLIEYPSQPLIEVEIKDQYQQLKSIFILPELCKLVIEEQNFNEIELFRKYNFWHTEPFQLVDDIKKVVKILNNSDQFQDFAKTWNLRISLRPTKFDYQFLEPGSLVLKNNQEAKLISFASAYGASHFDDIYKMTFLNGFQNIPKLENWLIIHYNDDMDTVDEFINTLQSLNEQHQYGISRPQQRIISSLVTDDWIKELFQVENADFKFITIIVRPEVDSPSLYKKIKDGITVTLGIPTQIIKTDTLQMFSFSQKQEVIANKSLTQMAVKLGGSPWIVKNLPYSNKPGIVVGFNVLKNQLSQKVVVSIACSTNRYFSRYYSDFKILSIVNNDYEKLKKDIAQSMTQLLKEAIQNFLELHKMQIEIIVIYRDGYYLFNAQQEIQSINTMLLNDYKSQQKDKYKAIFITSKEISKSPRFFIHDQYDYVNKDYIRNSGQGTIIQNQGETDYYIMVKKEKVGCSRVNHVKLEYIDSQLQEDVNYPSYIQNLTYRLTYQNFNYSPYQSTCAPLSYAFKYSKFISMLLPIVGDNQQQPDFSIIQALSKKGQLFYL